jgi:hypothetical protein
MRNFVGGWHDGSPTRISADGKALVCGTLLGGGDDEPGVQVAMRSDSLAVIPGAMQSADFKYGVTRMNADRLPLRITSRVTLVLLQAKLGRPLSPR